MQKQLVESNLWLNVLKSTVIVVILFSKPLLFNTQVLPIKFRIKKIENTLPVSKELMNCLDDHIDKENIKICLYLRE